MKTNKSFLFVCMTILTFLSCATSKHLHHSKYAGEEKREIKSLSNADIKELKKGGGWGLAKAAELNGMPGPIHLLEMKSEINLSAAQIEAIEALYAKMRNAAVPLGHRLIELEKNLNQAFANKTITASILQEILAQIARVRKELRFVHLSAHLQTPDIVTPEQIKQYNHLRGYDTNDPCNDIPKGHDPVLWKKHHGCE